MSLSTLNQRTQLLRMDQVDLLTKSLPPIPYEAVPYETDKQSNKSQRWRVRFMLANDPSRGFGLDLFDEVVFGRGTASFNLVNLNRYELDAGGVSRRHLMLRPTETNLFVIDMGSTNGTLRNGRSIGVNTPYALTNGDTLSLGDLDLVVQIVERPNFSTGVLKTAEKPDIADALSQIAKAITSQLDINEVLNQVAETAMALTAAGEAGIWLVDENNGQLFLEAQRGIADAKLRRMRLSMGDDSPASRVIRTGDSVRVQRQPGEERIKVMTNYLVEALVYTPITLGGITFGVLSAAHREPGKVFDKRDERLLTSIADFAAIAIQNARLFQATDQALAQRVQELSALNQLAYAVSSSLDLKEVYSVFTDQISRYWPERSIQLYLVDTHGNVSLFRSSLQGNKVTSQLLRRGMVNKVAQSGRTLVGFEETERGATGTLKAKVPISVACVPLLAKGKVVGVLALSNKTNAPFSDDDIAQLETFANPMATAVENARLFEESERQRAAIQATAGTLSQPLLILDNNGRLLIANKAANKLLETNMAQLFEGISSGVGKTEELIIGAQTFLATVEHLPEVGTIVVMQDITYVKQLENERVEFIHLLSHDLRSPLTSIVGWAHLLPRVNPLNEKGEQYIEGITKATSRMLDMINQLLRTATQAEAVELVKAPCQFEDVVRKTLSDLEGAALGKQINFNQEVEGEPYAIFGDADRLYHMVLNLVSNAVKYSPEKTAVTVVLEYGDELVLRVQDEGAGIDEEELPHIFNRYYRGKAGEASGGDGVGLGLSGVWAIAEAHGGTAIVRNRPEGGAEFIIRLPQTIEGSDR